MTKHAYFIGDLALKTPLLFIRKGRWYVMEKDNDFKYPASVVEVDKGDWIVFDTK